MGLELFEINDDEGQEFGGLGALSFSVSRSKLAAWATKAGEERLRNAAAALIGKKGGITLARQLYYAWYFVSTVPKGVTKGHVQSMRIASGHAYNALVLTAAFVKQTDQVDRRRATSGEFTVREGLVIAKAFWDLQKALETKKQRRFKAVDNPTIDAFLQLQTMPGALKDYAKRGKKQVKQAKTAATRQALLKKQAEEYQKKEKAKQQQDAAALADATKKLQELEAQLALATEQAKAEAVPDAGPAQEEAVPAAGVPEVTPTGADAEPAVDGPPPTPEPTAPAVPGVTPPPEPVPPSKAIYVVGGAILVGGGLWWYLKNRADKRRQAAEGYGA